MVNSQLAARPGGSHVSDAAGFADLGTAARLDTPGTKAAQWAGWIPAELPGARGTTELIGPFQVGSWALTVEYPGVAPDWLRRVVPGLADLFSLDEDWDRAGARPIAPERIASAIYLLDSIMQPNSPVPLVTPTIRGGVVLEWHVHGIDLEIDVISRDRAHAYYEDARTNTEWDRDIVGDLTPLIDSVAKLTARM